MVHLFMVFRPSLNDDFKACIFGNPRLTDMRQNHIENFAL